MCAIKYCCKLFYCLQLHFLIFNWKVCMLINIKLYMYIECYLCTHILKIRL